MIRHDVEQGSPEWFAVRLGKFTASEFDRVVTPGGKASTQIGGLVNKLVAEIITGKPTAFTESDWMKRGKELEQEARDALAFRLDVDIEAVGFVECEDGPWGCSPDGVYEGRGCELKCPAPHTHVQYLIDDRCPNDYYPQVQGAMWVTGAKSWDFVSYHPDMPMLVVSVKRDDPFIALLEAQVKLAAKRRDAALGILQQKGYLART